MALYRFAAGVIQRSKGDSSTAAAAYRAGVAIEDQRTGDRHDYSKRHGVLFEGIYAPKDAPDWTRDRQELWNRVEKAENRKDAQTAREFVIALPHELDVEQNRRLVQDFVRENFSRKGFIADVSIHAPSRGGDERNKHAHILVTMRKLDGDSFAAEKDRSQNQKKTLEEWRQSWEKLGNRHLEKNGFDATLDRRSWEAQGIDRTARLHLGKAAAAMEGRGIETEAGNENRARQKASEEAAKLRAELAELERLYALESQTEQKQDERHRQREYREAVGDVREFVSAVERQRREDSKQEAEEQRQHERAGLDQPGRSIAAAIWQLAKTAGATLSHIILGADHTALKQGRRLDLQTSPAPPPKVEAKYAREEITPARIEQRQAERDQLRKEQGLDRDARPADRLDLQARKIILEDARQEQQKQTRAKAEAVFEKYDSARSSPPPKVDPKYTREETARSPEPKNQATDSLRQTLGRRGGRKHTRSHWSDHTKPDS